MAIFRVGPPTTGTCTGGVCSVQVCCLASQTVCLQSSSPFLKNLYSSINIYNFEQHHPNCNTISAECCKTQVPFTVMGIRITRFQTWIRTGFMLLFLIVPALITVGLRRPSSSPPMARTRAASGSPGSAIPSTTAARSGSGSACAGARSPATWGVDNMSKSEFLQTKPGRKTKPFSLTLAMLQWQGQVSLA